MFAYPGRKLVQQQNHTGYVPLSRPSSLRTVFCLSAYWMTFSWKTTKWVPRLQCCPRWYLTLPELPAKRSSMWSVASTYALRCWGAGRNHDRQPSMDLGLTRDATCCFFATAMLFIETGPTGLRLNAKCRNQDDWPRPSGDWQNVIFLVLDNSCWTMHWRMNCWWISIQPNAGRIRLQ